MLCNNTKYNFINAKKGELNIDKVIVDNISKYVD